MNKQYELVKFEQDDLILDVNVSPSEDTVWLSKEDISILFGRDRSVITKHINNIYKEGELDRESTCAKNAHVRLEGARTITRTMEFYNLDVNVSPSEDTVWLTQEAMALLFDRDQGVISRHINNIFKEGELEGNTSMQKMHKSQNPSNPTHRPPVYYNLDVVISVGYRVKSQNVIIFRRWAMV